MAEVSETTPPAPLASQWTEEDRTIFDHAVCWYGKAFSAMRRVLPHKTAGELVAFFYDRKCRCENRGGSNCGWAAKSCIPISVLESVRVAHTYSSSQGS